MMSGRTEGDSQLLDPEKTLGGGFGLRVEGLGFPGPGVGTSSHLFAHWFPYRPL